MLRTTAMSHRTGVRVFLFAIASLITGAVGGVLAVARFSNPSPEPVSRPAAIDQAVREGGAMWPGTVVHVARLDPARIRVERRWLDLEESTSIIHRVGPDWQLGATPEEGIAEGVQVVIGILLPGIMSFLVVIRLGRRRVR